MATTATEISDWTGRISGGVEFADTVVGMADPSENEVYKRETVALSRHRYLKTVTAFGSVGGDEVVGSSLTIESGGVTLPGSPTAYYICVNDMLTPCSEGVDLWREDQTWKSYKDWELYTPTTSA